MSITINSAFQTTIIKPFEQQSSYNGSLLPFPTHHGPPNSLSSSPQTALYVPTLPSAPESILQNAARPLVVPTTTVKQTTNASFSPGTTCWASPLPTPDVDAVITADETRAMDLCRAHGTTVLHDDVLSIRTLTWMTLMSLPTPALRAGRVVLALQQSPGISTYGGNDRKMTAREENESELLDKMNAMTVKIKKLETTIASRPSTTARPIDGDCCVHGNGRRSFFSRRRCICI
ncbi:hypothetical protein QSH57_015644 [Fusarium oxysporum f. sp. vasinfectum]|nr:hypothetical protein QSH57_015644 [Fusarium oxysporum f. sp. vasinfectum]